MDFKPKTLDSISYQPQTKKRLLFLLEVLENQGNLRETIFLIAAKNQRSSLILTAAKSVKRSSFLSLNL